MWVKKKYIPHILNDKDLSLQKSWIVFLTVSSYEWFDTCDRSYDLNAFDSLCLRLVIFSVVNLVLTESKIF